MLYLGDEIPDDAIDRLLANGGERVRAANLYWERWGVTVQDPDGYRLVLSQRRWA